MKIYDIISDFKWGQVVYKEFGQFGPRLQELVQLVYVFKGHARISVDGHINDLPAGYATLLLPGRTEFFSFSTTEPTHHGWCEARAVHLDEAAFDALEALPFRVAMSDRMRMLDGMLIDLDKDRAAQSCNLQQSLAQCIFQEFLYCAGYQPGEQGNVQEHPAVRKAIAFMEVNYSSELDLEQVAAGCGVGGAHLIRLFKEFRGTTPVRYLWKVRSEAAAALLERTGLSAAEIAYKTGFANPAHFSRVFKNHYQVPPVRYRSQCWKAKEPSSRTDQSPVPIESFMSEFKG
ncbi:HTH-type transcriptional activator Btr [Pontiella desulfatans]|uniref:HTH-type transcriptional activator Btr n=1 Tax=Pontiella desulfatans TaxID=2750659 RepID=A0A6C2U9Z9_PONDE|nr:helix-turn-helix domain-containing protein [Pontiella desulfatans]VGO16206.1 HTH-type transcriptional activator Btr [Pontiella desulfatans]